ncbi:MAG TPA: CHAT domain-containing protein [Thermoanaerobaculia bacterium]|nr:CHAT domain-containing protein [Thermoanaerobaculia bacterium]
MTQLEIAIEEAERGSLTEFGWKARQKHALVLANLGRSREATEDFAQLAKTAQFPNPCEQGKFLSNWAWAALLAHEASGERASAKVESPEELLEQAIERIRSDSKNCDSKAVLNARLNLVLAHLQTGDPERATRELVSARKAKAESTLFLQLWELDLDARIELARGQPKPALEIYRRLDRIAKSVGSPDGRLRAALGLARATNELGDRDGALAILASAELLLDGQSLQVPLYDGRQTYVSQREGVASLEVQLLLDADRNAEALAAARRGRSRVLRQLDLSERLASLSPGDRTKWSDEILKYTRARGEIDQAAHQDWSLLAGEVATERAAREKKARETAETLERAIAILGEPPPLRLAPVPPGELLLAFHPLPRGPRNSEIDWVAFATDGQQKTSVLRFGLASALASDAALARAILLPFREQILGAKRIRILPYGPLRDIDFQALPFDDDILLAARPVVYGLDLSQTSGAWVPQGSERQALVVANPSGNLPGSVAEAKAVEKAIRSWTPGWQVERLEESMAEKVKVRTELGSVELFHFSGHGRFAGVGGSDSNLLLAADRRLTVGEVLVLAHAPRWVLLAGCETGRVAPEARVEGLGLANAFVLAGSRAVVASVRSVDDPSAESLFVDLYRRWRGESDLAQALQQTLLQWRSQKPGADWKSFRLIEP